MRTPNADPGSAILDEPWKLRADDTELTVRGSDSRDLAAVAIMHRRCSARALLARYRLGGRAPAVLALDRQLRGPLSYVVTTAGEPGRPGAVIALAVVEPDDGHGAGSARLGVLVEDSWQRQGIGRELVRHLAGSAALAGYTQLIAYSGSGTALAQRMLVRVGATRYVVDDEGGHLHTSLPTRAVEGLGPIRSGRFVWGDHGLSAAARALPA